MHDRAHGRPDVRAAPAEVGRPLLVGRQRRIGAGVADTGAVGVAGERPLRRLLEQLAGLVGPQRDAVVEPCADEEGGGAGGLARVDRAGGPLHRDRALASVLGRVGTTEERAHRGVRAEARLLAPAPAELLAFQPLAGFGAEAFGVRHRALDQHRVFVCGGVVVLGGVEVVAGVRLHDPAFVGVLRGRFGEGRVVEAAVGALDHLRAVVGGVDDAEREVVRIRHERVPDLDRHDLAVGADADRAFAVVALLGGVEGAAGAVVVGGEVARQVAGFVVVVEGVPAGDVVGEPVAVVVEVGARNAFGQEVARLVDRAAPERVDQVLGCDELGRTLPADVGQRHARVVRPVFDVHDAVPVAVVGAA